MQEGQNVTNQVIDKTLVYDRTNIKGSEIGILRTPYYLEENEFNILISSNDGFNDWAKRFLFIAFGLSINLLSKLIVFISRYGAQPNTNENLPKIKIEIDSWEYWSCLIAFVASLIAYVFAQRFKSIKAKLKSKIILFFNSKD